MSYYDEPGHSIDVPRQEAFNAWALERLGVTLPQKVEYRKLFSYDNHESVHVYTAIIGGRLISSTKASRCRFRPMHFGISRQAFYRWKRRYEAHGEGGLCDRPRLPGLGASLSARR